MSGLTDQGLEVETEASALAGLEADIASELGPQNFLASSVWGNILGPISRLVSRAWQALQGAYDSLDPNNATGTRLEGLSLITGTRRQDATRSTVTLSVTLADGTTLTAGRQVRAAENAPLWRTTQDVTATSGDGAYDVEAEAVEAGATAGPAGSLTEIVTPVVGWSAVTNVLDALVGRDRETDPELRIRRTTELAQPGSGTRPALEAAISAVAGVTDVLVVENPKPFPVDGVPAHAFRPIVKGGDNQAIFDVIGPNASTNARIDGSIEGVASNGTPVAFSRPDEVDLYVVVNSVRDSSYVNGTLPTAIAAARVPRVGEDQTASALYAAALAVPGVLDADITIGTAPSPTGTSVTIDATEIGVYDSTRVAI